MDDEVHAVVVLGYLVTEERRQKLVNETAKDDYLRAVISCLSTGDKIEGLQLDSKRLSVAC